MFESSFFSILKNSVLHGFWLDLSSAAYLTVLPLFFLIVQIILQKKLTPIGLKIILILSFALIFLIGIADAEIFKQWSSKFNNQILVYISHPKEMAISAGASNFTKTFIFGIIFLFLFVLVYKWIINKLNQSPVDSRKSFGIILVILVINFVFLRGGISVKTISHTSAIYSASKIENSAATNSFWNAIYYLFNNSNQLYGNSMNYLDNNFSKQVFNQQVVIDSGFELSLNKKPNVIVVMLESFTASASNFFSKNNQCMPYLDQIAQENLSFLECYASGDRTEKGLISVLSAYPAQPLSSVIVFPEKMQKLPSVLNDFKKENYNTSFIYGGDIEFASMKSYLVVNQTDLILDVKNFESQYKTSKWGVHDEYLFSKAQETLKQAKEPFFTGILTLSSHEPYDVPKTYQGIKKDEWFKYKNSIRYTDECLNNFIEFCKTQKWYNNTLIILVADHGHDIGLPNLHYFDKQKYHIPLVVLGGALNPIHKKTSINYIVSQTIIPSLITPNKYKHQYNWQSSLNDSNGFAQYHFNNGFGRITKKQDVVFDNDSKTADYYTKKRLNQKDSVLFLNQGKSFQQELIKDFLKR